MHDPANSLLELRNGLSHPLFTVHSNAEWFLSVSRISLQIANPHHTIERVKVEFELEEDQLEIVDTYALLKGVPKAAVLHTILHICKVQVEGDVEKIGTEWGLEEVKGFRKVVDDGNTIIADFWDQSNLYLLYHEIKY